MTAVRSERKGRRILHSRLFAGGLFAIILFSDSRWETIGLTSAVLFFSGALLVGIATVGRLWCSLYISGYKTKQLVKTGPYSLSRNPLYFFSLLGAIGVGMVTETLTIPVVIAAGFALYYPSVIREEESRLAEIHGDEYMEYRLNTPLFLPSISLLKEPEEYTVNPRIFRKSIFEALWFVWILGIIELLEEFHATGVIPTLFHLY